ncbi:Major facilitator superfamily domain-containing protein 6 [Stylophora pistillata]|uniref:Major facilitator superfamily domain-containing protein 6 n=1 Tax=Stylophora pistillata TaxID=50429 RepID=A0A2B4SL46_STYPI|nr:Major facilitator superfamily domain-containing protein 6 [Stylophora pistillata]
MATGAFLPYLGVFYKQLWLTARQSGILLGVRPFVKMLCSPLWGMVTDVCNKPKLILLVSILGTTVAHFSQSIVSPFHLPCYPDVNITNFSKIRSNLFAQYSVDRSSRQSGFPATNTIWQGKSLTKGADETNESSAENASIAVRGSVATEKFLIDNDFDKQKELGKDMHPFDYGTAQKESMENTGPRHEDKPRQITEANSKILTKNKKRKNPNMKNDFRVKDNQSIFATLLVIVFLGEFIAAPAPMLTDSGTLGILSGREHQYGRQRLFGSVGWGIGSLLSGAVVTAFNSCPYEDSINYVSCFYVFAGAMILDFFVGLFFNFVPAPSKQDVSNMENEFFKGLKIFYNLKNGAFICTLLFLGFSHSLQLSFLFWFLQDIGGTPILFTIIVAVNCLSEVGPQPGSGATIQGIIHGVYWGLGMAVGGVIGGLMVHSIGARLTFRLEAALSFAILVLFFAINNFHQKSSQYSQIPSEPVQDPDDDQESAIDEDRTGDAK